MQLGPLVRRAGSDVYQLSEYDRRTGANARRFMYTRESTFSGANTTWFMQSSNVPPNLCLVLEQLHMSAGPDVAGAEVLTDMQIRRTEQGLVIAPLLRTFSNVAAGIGQTAQLNLTGGPIVLMPGEDLSFYWVKSAAVQTFRINTAACGWYLPRANIQSG